MILKSIELRDFMCYAGSNKMVFADGINLIIGDNGYGKSKLFDAFHWVMYDECFDSSLKKFSGTRFMKKQIVSDKAIHDTEEGMVTASVMLIFHNEREHEYQLERRYSVHKRSDEVKEQEGSELIIRRKDMSILTASIINDPEEIERIKASVLPANIKPYMWFQGEQVESIIDFNKDASLTQAINVLSNIARYDNLVGLSESLKEDADKEYNKKIREQSKDREQSEELELKRRQLLEKIEAYSLQELKLKDNLAEAEERSEALIQRVAAAEQIRELEGKREQAIANLEQVNEDLNEELMFYHKRMFTSKWVLKGTEPLFASYSIKYGAYDKKKLELRAELQVRLEQETQLKRKMQTRLPIDVPEPIHVERMLEAERCLVCDRVAERGSEAWNKIKELLDRTHDENKALEEEAHTVHDFSPDLKRLYNNGLALAPSVQGVDRDIANTRKQIKKYETRRKVISQDLDKLAASIQELISNSALDINAAKNLLHDYTAQSENVRRFDREAGNLGHDIASLKEARDKINEQLQALVTGELPAYLEEKVKVLTEFHMVTHSTRDRVFKQLVSELEKEANTHYADMTKGNLSARGIIHLKELANGNYMPELVDDQGNALLNLNTGNIILIKLATIMAIISARQGTRATDLYTLITDAPMSVFGEDYTLGFCRTVSKVYRQSIIMSKEFYKNIALRDQLFNDPEIKLGKVYEITPSIPEAERANRNSLATIIKALN